MKASKTTGRQARRIHRWLVPIAAAPLLITAGTGSIYSLLLEQNIDAFWLLKLHTGQFGWLNLQPVYPILLGALTIVVTMSGLTMLLRPARTTGGNHPNGLTPRRCSRRSHCHGRARGWGDQWHRPLNRNSGHREQQPGTPAPHRCNSDRHRE